MVAELDRYLQSLQKDFVEGREFAARVAGDRLRTLQERQDVGAPDGSIWQLLPDAAHTQAEPRPKVAVLSR